MSGKTIEAVLIAGPTASGKSALALDLARAHGGVVINADSMQVYRDLRVITARPSAADEALVPHRLYGHVDAAQRYSVGAWMDDAVRVLGEARAQGQLPIFVGGTGLYFKALLQGLSAIPPIPEGIREALRGRLDLEGPEALHDALAIRDPEGAARLQPGDRIRIVRALEVLEATGRPIAEWHGSALPAPIAAANAVSVFLAPERDALYDRIDRRFAAMMDEGALAEVEQLAARNLDLLLPAMKAHGVPWLIRFLRGDISREDAITGSQADTRHYAKRQHTWFRHQLPEFAWIEPQAAGKWLSERF